MFQIKKIKRADYPIGKKFTFGYWSDKYYDVTIDGLNINLELKDLPKTLFKESEIEIFESDKKNLQVYIVYFENKEVGVISFSHIKWNNTLRIWDLYINKDFQKKGIGKKLINIAVEYAKQKNIRAIVLETQTSNYNAIKFYFKVGFKLVGIDTINYSNNDLKNREVRIELGYLL